MTETYENDCRHAGRTVELHPCPYCDEIYGDGEPHCHCCDECIEQCAMDI